MALCEKCKCAIKISAQTPERIQCPNCKKYDQLKLIRLHGWYCTNCNCGPYEIGVSGLRIKTHSANAQEGGA